jgi:hypothetical protein
MGTAEVRRAFTRFIATPNTNGLCSLNQMSLGSAVTRPTSAAPAPSATNTAAVHGEPSLSDAGDKSAILRVRRSSVMICGIAGVEGLQRGHSLGHY